MAGKKELLERIMAALGYLRSLCENDEEYEMCLTRLGISQEKICLLYQEYSGL